MAQKYESKERWCDACNQPFIGTSKELKKHFWECLMWWAGVHKQ